MKIPKGSAIIKEYEQGNVLIEKVAEQNDGE